MTDRELLENAAKAAGIALEWQADGWAHCLDTGCEWNPLTDDGDALRLAVKLEIDIEHNPPTEQQAYVVASRRGCEMMFAPVSALEDVDGYREAATRRAIVRAAAEIGRSKE